MEIKEKLRNMPKPIMALLALFAIFGTGFAAILIYQAVVASVDFSIVNPLFQPTAGYYGVATTIASTGFTLGSPSGANGDFDNVAGELNGRNFVVTFSQTLSDSTDADLSGTELGTVAVTIDGVAHPVTCAVVVSGTGNDYSCVSDAVITGMANGLITYDVSFTPDVMLPSGTLSMNVFVQ
jgi:hypothetical protein